MTNDANDKPKIIVDDDWKERVQAEREALKGEPSAQDAPTSASEQPPPGAIPPASFPLMISSLATQALMALGQVADPTSQGPPQVDLPIAKHQIDMLGVLEEKTKGNLTNEEEKMLEGVLHDLRMIFVSASRPQ